MRIVNDQDLQGIENSGDVWNTNCSANPLKHSMALTTVVNTILMKLLHQIELTLWGVLNATSDNSGEFSTLMERD
ncbi:hypothetical protein C0J52_17468 [Blattella germanica]|nr:hypothetical protein C0J52_17468 [Blattella germanica]